MKQIIFIFMAILLATGMASAQKKQLFLQNKPLTTLDKLKKPTEKYLQHSQSKIQVMPRWLLLA